MNWRKVVSFFALSIGLMIFLSMLNSRDKEIFMASILVMAGIIGMIIDLMDGW